MAQDNPFADDEGEKTVIRPNPAGRRPAAPAAAPSAPPLGANPLGANPLGDSPYRPPETAAAIVDLTLGGLNPLVAAASPLLALAARLRRSANHADVEGLRARIARELQVFAQRTAAAGLSPEIQKAGHYALCAMIDDVVGNTPWGASTWARQSMSGTFHNDVASGDRFFEFLTFLQREPGRFGDVLELMYLCLSLGFEGKWRVAARGAAEHARIREGLYTTLRQRRGEFERELSPHWRGLEAPHRPLTSVLPGWVVGLGAAAAAALLFIAFSYSLNARSDDVYERLSAMPPSGKVSLAAQQPVPPAIPTDGTLARLRTFLAPEIRDGLVTLGETAQTATIRLTSQNMFDSGSATVNPALLSLLGRVAQALDTEPGTVLVLGHTDNVPIRSVRFPSNFHLSSARAAAVGDIVKGSLKLPQRLTTAGRADSDPLAPNTTPEGRAANRRIELVLTKQEPSAL